MDVLAQHKVRIVRMAKFLFWASLFAILVYQVAPLVGTVLLLMAKAVVWILAAMIAFVVVVIVAFWLANLYAELRKQPEK